MFRTSRTFRVCSYLLSMLEGTCRYHIFEYSLSSLDDGTKTSFHTALA